jgi:excisionase family DNA binding protein
VKLDRLRDGLTAAREHVLAGESTQAVAAIDRALDELAPPRLLTTTEAAQMLGVRSVNTVKLWCRNGALDCCTVGNRVMVPLDEVERFKDDARVRDIRALHELHDSFAELGPDDPMSEEELAILSASRPGRLPWQAD